MCAQTFLVRITPFLFITTLNLQSFGRSFLQVFSKTCHKFVAVKKWREKTMPTILVHFGRDVAVIKVSSECLFHKIGKALSIYNVQFCIQGRRA